MTAFFVFAIAATTAFDVRNLSEEQLDLQARPDLMARIAQEMVREPGRRAALAERGARQARPLATQEIVRGLLERSGV